MGVLVSVGGTFISLQTGNSTGDRMTIRHIALRTPPHHLRVWGCRFHFRLHPESGGKADIATFLKCAQEATLHAWLKQKGDLLREEYLIWAPLPFAALPGVKFIRAFHREMKSSNAATPSSMLSQTRLSTDDCAS